jgi:hypothetical protein
MLTSCVPTYKINQEFYYHKTVPQKNNTTDFKCINFMVLIDSNIIKTFDAGPFEGNLSYHRRVKKIINDYFEIQKTDTSQFKAFTQDYELKKINKNCFTFSFTVLGNYRHRENCIDTLTLYKNGLTSKFLDIDSNLVIEHYKHY